MDFLVTDRQSIEHGILVHGAYVVVSIRDPRRPRARVRCQSGLRDILYLAFSDAEPTAILQLPNGIRLMTAAQAEEIWAFVRSYQDRVPIVAVHCEQGLSRSPAVAAALSRWYTGDDCRFFRAYQPNLYVYQLMLKTQHETGER